LSDDDNDVMYSSLDSSQRGHQLTVNLTTDDWQTSLTESDSADHTGGFRACSGHWKPAHHAVFQAAHAVLLVSFLIPNTGRTLIFIHLTLVAGKNRPQKEIQINVQTVQ